MGEYIIYVHGVIVAYVCDNRLLAKPARVVKEMMPDAQMVPPYEGAKEMVLVNEVDDTDFLVRLFLAIYEELAGTKAKKKNL